MSTKEKRKKAKRHQSRGTRAVAAAQAGKPVKGRKPVNGGKSASSKSSAGKRYALNSDEIRRRAEALELEMENAERRQIAALVNADRLSEDDLAIMINARED